MKDFTAKKLSNRAKENTHETMVRRQAANFERFMQEKADVFQVTETKAQAMFWALS